MRPDRPFAVVQVERWRHFEQLHAGVKIGINGADVPPVRLSVGGRIPKGVGLHTVPVNDPRNDVLAEVVVRRADLGILQHLLKQKPGVEYIDSHRRQRPIGVTRDRLGMFWLFTEPSDPAGLVHGHHAEFLGCVHWHLQAADGHVGLGLDVVGQQQTVVHLVDVVTGKNQHELRPMAPDDVEVLVDRVGCAQVPGAVDPLLGWNHLNELAEFSPQKVPSALDVVDQ